MRRATKWGEPLAALVVVLVAWQIASNFFPSYLFPPLDNILKEFLAIFDGAKLRHALVTIERIMLGLLGAFVAGVVLGLAMGMRERVAGMLLPIMNFIQGIPALSWVIIAVIWFRSVEFRIWFILVVCTLPGFALQVLDSYRAISKDLKEMVLSFRPTGFEMFRILTLPAIVPGILTAWKVNLGNATRVVLVAELVGATVGVGYQLSSAQQMFNMAAAIAWTLVLILFVLLAQKVLTVLENYLLRYRPQTERE